EAQRLEEQRLVCLERRIEADLALGQHSGLTGELATLCGEFPLRERLVELRMLALYRAGRRHDALAAYTETRRKLIAETRRRPRPARGRGAPPRAEAAAPREAGRAPAATGPGGRGGRGGSGGPGAASTRRRRVHRSGPVHRATRPNAR